MAKTERAMKLPLTMLARELRLGDTVQLFKGPWGTAVVRQVTEDRVVFFRPFVHLDAVVHIGGVTPYIGIEDFAIPRSASGGYLVLEREENLQ